jgi:hypothetical protein
MSELNRTAALGSVVTLALATMGYKTQIRLTGSICVALPKMDKAGTATSGFAGGFSGCF